MRKKIIGFALSPMLSALTSLCALLLALSFPAEAQQTAKVPRVGLLRQGPPTEPHAEAFRQGLRDLGYVEGKNILIEYRWTEGRPERITELATELVHLKVDVIVVGGSVATLAAKNATKTIPIVMASAGDPVGGGLSPLWPGREGTSLGWPTLSRT